MKVSFNFLLAFTAVILSGLHWRISVAKPAFTVPKSPQHAANAVDQSTEIESTGLGSNMQAGASFDWAAVETEDYKEYVKRLRAVGFPPELVREIVIADVNKMYEPREQAFNRKLVPYDAPMWQRERADIGSDDWQRNWQRIKELWQLRIEKQTVMESILDEYVPREILRTLTSRNYEAYEYALSQLPPAKREAVQWAQETEMFNEENNKVTIPDAVAELESFKRTRAECDEAMLKVLTPEEFDRYKMNTAPAGTELARRVIGMQPTDDEFQTMFRIAMKNWLDTGGVYGRWRAVPVANEQIAAADLEMNESLRQALGPDRFLDYQMAISGTGQQMRNFAARFELPRETMLQAFQLQSELDGLYNRVSMPSSGDQSAAQTPGPEQLQAQLQQLLGPELSQAWNIGRNLLVSLDP